MASYTIPEEVIGVPLFVPEDNDYFSIGTGEMPNGDDCLVIHGDVSRDYKAFQPSPAVSPDLFRTRTQTLEFSISFWINLGAVTNVSAATYADTIFAVMNSLNDATTNYQSTPATPNPNALWGVSAVGTNGIGYFEHGYKPSGGTWYSRGAVRTLTPNVWNLVVIGHAPNAPAIALNDEVSYSGGWTASDNSASPSSVGSGLQLGIGAYSDAGSVSGREGEYRLGKLAFHDHVLNETERLMLYHAMVG